ncbi:MAG: prefoldin subunit beta [Candidatus Aenigmarchaeota archaeon]|nr:prefoldin subunit beta [Candidatus Aenigmarchaeota archaeon]
MNEEQTQAMVMQFQQYQQQLQSVLIQKETLQMQLMEMNKAVEELDSSKNEKAYKITGQIMVSKPVEDIKKELLETKEALEIRIQSMEKTEEKITLKLKEMESELRKLMK